MSFDEGNAETNSYETDYERVRHLSLNQVSQRLAMLAIDYEAIKKNYTGPFGWFRRNLKPEDLQALGQAIGDLLHLSLNDEVQRQIQGVDPEADNSSLPFYRISSLNTDILLFMGKFENSGVTIIQQTEPN